MQRTMLHGFLYFHSVPKQDFFSAMGPTPEAEQAAKKIKSGKDMSWIDDLPSDIDEAKAMEFQDRWDVAGCSRINLNEGISHVVMVSYTQSEEDNNKITIYSLRPPYSNEAINFSSPVELDLSNISHRHTRFQQPVKENEKPDDLLIKGIYFTNTSWGEGKDDVQEQRQIKVLSELIDHIKTGSKASTVDVAPVVSQTSTATPLRTPPRFPNKGSSISHFNSSFINSMGRALTGASLVVQNSIQEASETVGHTIKPNRRV